MQMLQKLSCFTPKKDDAGNILMKKPDVALVSYPGSSITAAMDGALVV